MSERTSQIERVEKPWGYELIWARNKEYVAKLLFVRAGESLSLQYHQVKDETLFLESGECHLEAGEHESELRAIDFKEGTSFHVPPGLRHRINAITDCRIFEVSTNHLSDVVRLQDRYGRK